MNDNGNNENGVENHQCILENWSDEIGALTGLERARDLKEPYTALVKNLMVSRGSGDGCDGGHAPEGQQLNQS